MFQKEFYMDQNTAITREQVLRKRSEMLVIALVGKDLSDNWWNSQNKAFELKTPNEKWKENYETVYSYLMSHAEGEW